MIIPSDLKISIDTLSDKNISGLYDSDKRQITIILKNHASPHEFLDTFVHMISHHYTQEETHSDLFKEFASDLSNKL